MEENIDMPIEQDVTIELILSVFKNYSDSKRMKEIKDIIVSLIHPDELIVDSEERSRIENKVVELISIDKRRGDESELKYSNGKYSKRKKRSDPEPIVDLLPSVEYTGTAGECAVISELLFSGYNANRMMVDEGVDIIAVKDNIYYYVQVKTTTIKDGRVYAQIKTDRFNQFMSAQIRYIIVARYDDHGISRNMFFSFTPQQIDQAAYEGCIKKNENTVSIKIKFNDKTGKPYLYDNNECSCAWNWNKKDLLG